MVKGFGGPMRDAKLAKKHNRFLDELEEKRRQLKAEKAEAAQMAEFEALKKKALDQ